MRRFIGGLAVAAVLATGCQSPVTPQSAGQPPAAAEAPPATGSAAPPSGQTREPNPVQAENAQPGSRTWKRAVRRSGDPDAMSGYADRSSAVPGDAVSVFVSTTADSFRVIAYRMGWYGGAGAREVSSSPALPGQVQTQQGYLPDTRTYYAAWTPSATVDTTGWVPGMYLLRLAGDNGAEWLVPLVVRAPSAAGRLVLVMSDLTWQAYNTWGGASAYTGPGGFTGRSRAVSFSRPYLNGHGAGKYIGYEHPVVMLAERLGIPVSYVAASDLAHGDESLLAGAEGIVSLGHNEYWTVPERVAVTRARDAGVDLAFFGANTMYWRSRLEDGPQGMPLEVIYKSDEDPVDGPETTRRFRDEPSAWAERRLVGMDYECFPASGTYTVTDPSFFLFSGAGDSTTYEGLIDVEVDRAYPLPGTPKSLQIVADSPTMCGSSSTVSTSTYYSTKSGAGVFAVGTMGWVLRALRGTTPSATTRFARIVTENTLISMLQGRMGEAHPAQPNLDSFGLSPTNTTGKA